MNTVHQLDCSAETTAPRAVSARPGKWLATDITDQDWKVIAGDEHLQEIDAMASALCNGDAITAITDKPVHCLAAMQKMQYILTAGVGFAVFDRLPVHKYPTDVLVSIYQFLGNAMGRRVEQKYSGQMLYHVHDSGKQFQYGVRGSHTSIELNFHTDNAFGQMVPDTVGLLCVAAAKSGGISRFCSLYAVHERLEQRFPEELNRLYEPMLFDRQKEHGDDEPPVTWAPFFSWRGNRLFARANPSLVRKGYEVAGVKMSTPLREALQAVDVVSTSEDLWYEAALEPGQIQYLNNHEIGHYRSEFVDHDDPARRRSLYRLWHRANGTTNYHGV